MNIVEARNGTTYFTVRCKLVAHDSSPRHAFVSDMSMAASSGHGSVGLKDVVLVFLFGRRQ